MGSASNARQAERRLTRAQSWWASGLALACSTVLFYFGTGLTPVSGLTWLAPLPVLLLAPYVATGRVLSIAFVSYVASTANSWSFYAQSSDTPLWPVGLLIIVSFGLTLVLAVWVFRRLVTRGRVLLATFTAPALWVATLYVISVSNPMGIMGTLATTQADVPPVVKVAAVTGWFGVEFLVFFVPTALAAVLSPGILTASRVRTGVVGVLVVGLAMAGGVLRPSQSGSDERTQLAVVVHNHSGWGVDVDTAEGRALVDAYADEVAALPAGTETAVLPEGAFLVDDQSVGVLTERMTRVARERDLTLVVGFNRKSHGAKFNTALVIPPDGGRPVPYLKHHDMVSKLGHELVHLPDTGRRVGVEICLDVNFANPSRDYAASGAKLMVIPASDNDENGWQHGRTALLRGVENGFAVAWADRDGHPMIAESNGRVLAEGHTGGVAAFTTLVADVPDGPGATPYTRFGDWFAWLTILIGLGGLASTWFNGTRRRPSSRGSHGAGPPANASAPLGRGDTTRASMRVGSDRAH